MGMYSTIGIEEFAIESGKKAFRGNCDWQAMFGQGMQRFPIGVGKGMVSQYEWWARLQQGQRDWSGHSAIKRVAIRRGTRIVVQRARRVSIQWGEKGAQQWVVGAE